MKLLSVGLKDLGPQFLQDLGGQRYRLNLPTISPGWSGIVLIVGRGPFERSLFDQSSGAAQGNWSSRFLTAARAGGWTTEMAWYQSINAQPDTALAR
jgi:eukaryotic-like serine/threonine-protein kinase